MANPVDVTLNTSGLSGQAGALVFDLNAPSTASSSLTINDFSGDFTPDGSPEFTGGASGDIVSGFTLTDSAFFNEVAVPVVFGTTASFDFSFSFGTPEPFEFPNELSVFLLTPDLSQSLISTGDPTGADSILDYFVDAAGTSNLSTYDAIDGSVRVIVGSPVPEPSPLALIIVPLAGLLLARARKPSCSCPNPARLHYLSEES
jgi:hypothetical protein